MFTKRRVILKSAACPSPSHCWADMPTYSPRSSLTLPSPFPDPTKVHIKTKTQDGHPHEGLHLLSCQRLEWASRRITGDIQGEITENVVPVISQGWKLKPLAATSSSAHWCLSFLELSIGYASLLLPLLAGAQIACWFSKLQDFDELMPLLHEVSFRTW